MASTRVERMVAHLPLVPCSTPTSTPTRVDRMVAHLRTYDRELFLTYDV